jgi:amino acid adenylation domain-containing protein
VTGSLPALLEAAAARDPGSIAVRDGARTLTYGQAAAAMRGLAASLAGAGVRAGDRVGILLPKSADSVLALLGAMRAGAAYVPVDPGAPMRRARRILADAGVSALITTPGELAKRPGLLGGPESPAPAAVLLAGPGEDPPAGAIPFDQAARRTDPPPAAPGESDLAYILYTSGSTGDPKGVALTHGNALAFVRWAAAEVALTPADALSSHAPFHFDLSIFDLYAAFLAGASVTLVPDSLAYFPRPLAEWIAGQGISVWYSVPSVLGRMATSGALEASRPARLRAVLFAGEVFPLPPLRALRRALPEAVLLNLYGPTETNVCTWHRVPDHLPDDRREPLPIGRPCPYAECLVVGPSGAVTATGEEGELWVRGASTLRGYWNDAARTAGALAGDPRPGTAPGAPYYRTGDIVRWRADGELDFLGRRDAMVKARGYRIELGDVEAALHDHPAVEDAAALVVRDPEGENHLHAAVVLRPGSAATATTLQRHCLELVPRYMVPESVALLRELPRTSTGKVDRITLARRFENGASTEAR